MRIAIAGYGVEGRSNYSYWNQPENTLTILDDRSEIDDLPPGVEVRLGSGAFDNLKDFDMVVRTAGLAPRKLSSATKIWSSTNEFFAKCPCPIIGVTGTKGKGTTSSLIASMLRAAGIDVHLVGNIGLPALDVLPKLTVESVVVYELSSFQLWDLERSPHVAVVLMIEPDHLDVHADMAEYVAAKMNIAKHQQPSDVIIYNYQNDYARQIAESTPADTKLIFPYDIGELKNHLKLPGQHNVDNAAAAILAARQFTDDEAAIARGLEDFIGLDHRLKFVRAVDEVKYYDDSIATTPGSAVAALNSFDAPKIIILGGSDKGSDYAEIIAACREADAKVIAIGQTGARIYELCQQMDVEAARVEGGMDEVVKKAHELAAPGDVVILSPASASFDQYRNYVDRGEQFIEAVQSLAVESVAQ